MTNIIMAIAIVVLTAAICVLTKKQKDIEEELDIMIMATKPIEKPDLDEVEQKFAEANAEIEKIFARLEEIADDIGRLDALTDTDHKNLVDIRERYILYREPVDNGAGVPWASEYRCKDDE